MDRFELRPGQKLTYCDGHGEVEHGVYKSQNDTIIFVVFRCDNNWAKYYNYTAQGCSPENLYPGWISKEECTTE